MGRPRERGFTVIRSFSIDKALSDRLDELAWMNRTTASKLLEEILMRALNEPSMNDQVPASDAQAPALTPKLTIDPLTQMEIDNFTKEVNSFEAEVADLEKFKNTPPNIPKWADEVTKKNIPIKHKFDVLHKKEALEDEWSELRIKFDRLRRGFPEDKVMELGNKLVELKKRLEAI